jgi:hypothetical protein
MSLLSYQCDGCGMTTSEQRPLGWRTVTPAGLFTDHLLRSVPVQSHLCGACWRVAIDAVHSRTLATEELCQVRSDTVEMTVIEQSWTATR